MRTRAAVKHFQSKRRIASLLHITPGSVSLWGEYVPPLRAAQLHALSGGALAFDPNLKVYRDWYGPTGRRTRRPRAA